MALVLVEVSDVADTSQSRADELRVLHQARAAAELARADALDPGSDAVASNGALLAEVMLVKGRRGPAEEAGGPALSGPDGEAADAALVALGYDPSLAFRTLSRPEPDSAPERRRKRLRLQIEAVDPTLIIALDEIAAEDVAATLGIGPLASGVAHRAHGRSVLAVGGLEASLTDEAAKRRVWSQFKAVARPGASS